MGMRPGTLILTPQQVAGKVSHPYHWREEAVQSSQVDTCCFVVTMLLLEL